MDSCVVAVHINDETTDFIRCMNALAGVAANKKALIRYDQGFFILPDDTPAKEPITSS
jgi:hypothetical protein